jgi:glucokinase
MRLVGDIGGTNARFAIAKAGQYPSDPRKLPIARYPGLVEAVRDYLAGRPPVQEAVLAVASPVLGDEVSFTNSPWRFSIEETRQRLGLRELIVINDLLAQATSFASLRADEVGPLKPGRRKAGRPIVVIGPGTGLGVAFLSEAGHATFAPADHIQADILLHLQRRHGHVSAERLLSGPGLLALATTLATMRGQTLDLHDPRDVSARAADGSCPICCEAIRIFSSILGSTSGDLALTLLADGGVILTGGLCRGLRPLLDLAVLAEGFTAKGRFRSYLEDIPIDQILRPHAGLLGAALYEEADAAARLR